MHGHAQYSVLTGDFLLSKAIVALARLQNVHVVALMSRAVADFIEGKSRVLNQAPGPHEVPAVLSSLLGISRVTCAYM